MSKKQLLTDLVCADELSIRRVFGQVAWEQFLELQPDDEIVVIGNGLVCSFHGEYIKTPRWLYGAIIIRSKLVANRVGERMVINATCN